MRPYPFRGYFEIGIVNGKSGENVGTLWRSASQLGAAGIFTVGRRYPAQCTDTLRVPRHIPLRPFETWEHFLAARPEHSRLVAIEQGGKPLREFCHPEQALYLLGSEDSGLPPFVLERCQHVVSIEAARTDSYNVAVAGALVMYHRLLCVAAGSPPGGRRPEGRP